MVVPLGSIVRDNITGLEGIAIAFVLHLHDCEWILLQPTGLKDGLPHTARFFDTQRIDILKATDREPREPITKPGNRVRDKITGFEGIVTTWTDELYGEPTVGITATILHEGRPIRDSAFPESRLEILEDSKAPVSESNTAMRGSIAEGPPRLPASIRG